MINQKYSFLLIIGVSLILITLVLIPFFVSGKFLYSTDNLVENLTKTNLSISITDDEEKKHVLTPSDGVRGLYMSSWVAGNKSLRAPIVDLIETTGLNAVVIDLKDVTGKVTYSTEHPDILNFGDVVENRIPDLQEFVNELHKKNIYVIGRIAVFQDDFSPHHHLEDSVQSKTGGLWSDRRGLEWFDVSSQKIWEYTVALSEDAYAHGVDEINLDYVRFPSDGNIQNMILPITGESTHPESLEKFFIFMDDELRFTRGIPLSADVFGITTTTNHDVGIGQIFEKIAPYVDAIAPMIYPSHYPAGFHGYDNPAAVPYEIITIATQGAIDKFSALGIEPQHHLRPWIQDFNLGATYDAQKVEAQIQALYDLGITSFLVWDPANTYTTAAYKNFDFTQGINEEGVL